MTCRTCGAECPEEAVFCPRCGTPLGGEPPSLPPAPPEGGAETPEELLRGAPLDEGPADAGRPPAGACPDPLPGPPASREERASGPEAPPVSPSWADFGVRRVRLKRVSVAAMILWTILTAGFYPFVWLALRLRTFNGMTAPDRALPDWSPYLLIGLHLVALFSNTVLLTPFVTLLSFVANVLVSFRVRSMLRDYAGRPGCPVSPAGVAAGPIMTFFFGALYLQYHINKMIYARAIEPSE